MSCLRERAIFSMPISAALMSSCVDLVLSSVKLMGFSDGTCGSCAISSIAVSSVASTPWFRLPLGRAHLNQLQTLPTLLVQWQRVQLSCHDRLSLSVRVACRCRCYFSWRWLRSGCLAMSSPGGVLNACLNGCALVGIHVSSSCTGNTCDFGKWVNGYFCFG